MGKGDTRTRRGKLFNRSYGISRLKTKNLEAKVVVKTAKKETKKEAKEPKVKEPKEAKETAAETK